MTVEEVKSVAPFTDILPRLQMGFDETFEDCFTASVMPGLLDPIGAEQILELRCPNAEGASWSTLQITCASCPEKFEGRIRVVPGGTIQLRAAVVVDGAREVIELKDFRIGHHFAPVTMGSIQQKVKAELLRKFGSNVDFDAPSIFLILPADSWYTFQASSLKVDGVELLDVNSVRVETEDEKPNAVDESFPTLTEVSDNA